MNHEILSSPLLLTNLMTIPQKGILKELESHLSNALDRFSIVAITNHKGVILYVNDNFCKISKYESKELIGKDHRIINSGFHEKAFFSSMWKTILSGSSWRGEVCNRTKDGELYWVDTHIAPIETDGEKYFVAVRNDITERKKAVEENSSKERQLLQADKMTSLGILTSGVAHEINNPNHLILSNNELLEKIWFDVWKILDSKKEDEGDFELCGIPVDEIKTLVPEMFDRIRDGSDRIKNIVSGLKGFAKEEPVKHFEKVSLNDVVYKALPLVQSLIKSSTQNFELDLDLGDPCIYGNFQQIEQVFINFITNACQALDHIEQGIKIKTQFDQEEKVVKLSVIDEGKGMNQDLLNKILNPFFTTKHDSGGTGLGLFVSYGIIEQHSGKLEFKSDVGQGCCASMLFPVWEYTNQASFQKSNSGG